MLSVQTSIFCSSVSYSSLAAYVVPVLSKGIHSICFSSLPLPAAAAHARRHFTHDPQAALIHSKQPLDSRTVQQTPNGLRSIVCLQQRQQLQQQQQSHQSQHVTQQQASHHWSNHHYLHTARNSVLPKQHSHSSLHLALKHQRHTQPWHQQQAQQYSSGPSSSSSSGVSGKGPKNVKGALPDHGPSSRTLRAIPFTVSRSEAETAFTRYHSGHWYQSRQQPALSGSSSSSSDGVGGFKETFLPFWVGSGVVRVEVRGAEVGHDHLVTRYDRTRGRAEPRWETVWSRVQVTMMWDKELRAEEQDMQIYASWKYFRRDVEALKPGTFVTLARGITPDMLKSSSDNGSMTRRVGPFTLQPHEARRIIMRAVEAAERQQAEREIAKLTGASQVRFVDMHCTWYGSTGAAAGTAAAAGSSSSGGLDLMPVYVPSYVCGWWHGGTKVRTFVSGVNLSVGGAHVLDDKKVATVVAAATTGATFLVGAPVPVVFWAGLVIPFVVSGVAARFWPLLRQRLLSFSSWISRETQQIFSKEQQKDYSDVDWDAAFVRSYTSHEQRHQYEEQQESYRQADRSQGDTEDPGKRFQEFMQDPFRWFERQYAKAQQQQRQQQQSSTSGRYEYRRDAGSSSSSSSGRSSGFSSSTDARDPKGYYKTLGVEPGATTPDVQAAFRGLALQYHPDRYQEAAEKARATKRFQAITEAYQVLRDPKKRRQYDAGQFRG